MAVGRAQPEVKFVRLRQKVPVLLRQGMSVRLGPVVLVRFSPGVPVR